MRIGKTIRYTLLFLACTAMAAHAQKMPAHVFSGGGGKTQSADGELRHFSAVGVGMAVGTAENGTHRAHHGFLGGARVFANQDLEPPEFDPPLQDVEVPVGQDNCLAQVTIPDVTATDDRDRNPAIDLILVIDADRELDVDSGEVVGLAPGSYDVLAVATDRRGNETRGSFIIDVVDTVDPVVAAPIPNPTPANRPAEATSPAGTRVAINFTCRDNCDNDPVEGDVPEVFSFGETQVQLTCTDASGNASNTGITVRVADTQGPTVVGQLPAEFEVACNSPEGARIGVPQVIWADNGTVPQDLEQQLVVDPGPGQQVFDALPGQLTLAVGAHVLRYQATDASGNSTAVELRVVVTDTSVPTIEVADLPANGWFGGDASFVFRVGDDCGSPDELQVTVEPQPSSMTREGNEYRVSYDQDGRYSLRITVTDDGGNSARENSVSFGIDRTPPEVSVAVPNQRGVDANDTVSYPFFGMGESLGLSVGAEDEGDGQPSGIRRIRVIADRGEFFERVLTERVFDGAGSPVRGDRAVLNIGCETQEQVDRRPVCTDGAVSLRYLEPGERSITILAEDFAGNEGVLEAFYVNSNLGAAMRRVRDNLNRIAIPCDTCPANDDIDAAPILLVSRQLDNGQGMTNVNYATAPYGTSMFLGGALKATDNSIGLLTQLIRNGEDAALNAVYTEQIRILLRAARSDLELYKLWVEDMDHYIGQAQYVETAYLTDLRFVDDYLEVYDDSVEAGQWTQASSNGVQAFFHIKMAHELWIMDYDQLPRPLEDADGEVDRFSPNYRQYAKSRAMLTAIRDELTQYLALNNKPAEDEMSRIRNSISGVIDGLDLLLEEGINSGLTDTEYLEALMDLRAVARNSTLAGNAGAYVRPYQFAIMQVVRWMTHFSLETARIFDDNSEITDMYAYAESSIQDGIELLNGREIQAVINLYGSRERALCPIIGIYHCWYLRDEMLLNLPDDDRPMAAEDIPDVCIEDLGMILPENWDAAPPGEIIPACRMTIPED